MRNDMHAVDYHFSLTEAARCLGREAGGGYFHSAPGTLTTRIVRPTSSSLRAAPLPRVVSTMSVMGKAGTTCGTSSSLGGATAGQRHHSLTMRTHSQQGRTYEVYGQALRCHLLPHFGQKDIATITREEVKQLAYGMLAQGKSRNTVMVTLAPLREMFNHAIEDRHVAVNPALGVMRLTKKGKGEQREKVTFLTREEVSVFLETCREHRPDYAPLVLLLVRTGLRIGEACALQWGDLDFLNRFIEVRRTYSNGRIEETPKSSKSRRVDMSQQLTEALKALLVERKKETLRKGWGEVPPWIFLREDGACLTPNYVRMRVWPKLSAKTGLRYVRIHDLRHTFARAC